MPIWLGGSRRFQRSGSQPKRREAIGRLSCEPESRLFMLIGRASLRQRPSSYLNFVDNQGHIYRDLKSCFAVFGLKNKLATLTNSRQTKPNIEAFDFVLGELDKRARMSMSSAIDTESNLTSKVFSNIATSLDIAMSLYETKFHLIDESLVRRRNKIAHGDYLDLDSDDFINLADNVLQIMRDYKTDLENAASMANYRRRPIAVRT